MISVLPLFILGSAIGSIPSENDISVCYKYNSPITLSSIQSTYAQVNNDLSFNINSNEDYFGFNAYDNDIIIDFQVAVSKTNLSLDRASDENLLDLSDNWVYEDTISYSYFLDASSYNYFEFFYNVSFGDNAITQALINGESLYFYWGISYTYGAELANAPGSDYFDIGVMNYSIGEDYENGYTNGLTDGYNNGFDNGYNSGVASQETVISSLRAEINRLNGIIEDYRSGNISLSALVWNIASSPFETFKTIWNVDLLGVNIANFTLGLMLVGVVLYIWKKFI